MSVDTTPGRVILGVVVLLLVGIGAWAWWELVLAFLGA
jgi:hypothetical protein